MVDSNLLAAWAGILLGAVAGAIQGLWFHHEDWLGGYASWRRRLLRLGHISFFGLAFVNLSFALSVRALDLREGLEWPSRLFLIGAVTMPLICYLSVLRNVFRHLFFVPVASVIVGATLFVGVLLS